MSAKVTVFSFKNFQAIFSTRSLGRKTKLSTAELSKTRFTTDRPEIQPDPLNLKTKGSRLQRI